MFLAREIQTFHFATRYRAKRLHTSGLHIDSNVEDVLVFIADGTCTTVDTSEANRPTGIGIYQQERPIEETFHDSMHARNY